MMGQDLSKTQETIGGQIDIVAAYARLQPPSLRNIRFVYHHVRIL